MSAVSERGEQGKAFGTVSLALLFAQVAAAPLIVMTIAETQVSVKCGRAGNRLGSDSRTQCHRSRLMTNEFRGVGRVLVELRKGSYSRHDIGVWLLDLSEQLW